MTLSLLEEWTEAGAGPAQSRFVLERWLAGHSLAALEFPAYCRASKRFLQHWPELERSIETRAWVVSRHPSNDGSTRLLVRLQDGQTLESVLLPREAVCVSTQIGCAVGCRFCKTGEAGLLRALSADEILVQVALAARDRRRLGLAPLRKVVLMGMGEPAHNLSSVLTALADLSAAGHFAHKQMVFSTVGDRRAFRALAGSTVQPALALSLHSLDDALREQLLPRAPRIPTSELLALALDYADSTKHPLQIQWTLMDSVNDGPGEVDALIEGLRGAYAVVNVIPWNHVEGMGFERPALESSIAFVRALKRGGVFATLRHSAGQDVDGGCGQLRSRSLEADPTEHLPQRSR